MIVLDWLRSKIGRLSDVPVVDSDKFEIAPARRKRVIETRLASRRVLREAQHTRQQIASGLWATDLLANRQRSQRKAHP